MAFLISWLLAAAPVPLAIPLEHGAVALGLFATVPDYDYSVLLDEIVEVGATEVVIAVVWSQATVQSLDIHRHPQWTANDATIARTLDQAKQRGLRTVLFPLLQIEQGTPEQWRGVLAPRGVDAWFQGYRSYVRRMAELARDHGADALSVGSEFASLESHDGQWRRLVAMVRTIFQGPLLYSANWDHFSAVPFWDALDVVGVTAYHELASDDRPLDDDALHQAWQAPLQSLRAFAATMHKPVVVTELGYPTVVSAARMPWNEASGAAHDEVQPARLLSDACRRLKPAVSGLAIWNWFGVGGTGDDGYSPRGKPAMIAAVRGCMETWRSR